MVRLIPIALLVLALSLLTACSDDDDGGDEGELLIRLGVVQSLSGDGAVYGRSGVEGIELAIEELEAANPGLRFEYIVVDDESSTEAGVRAYENFVENRVDAIIGPSLSNVALSALAVAQEAGIPAISPMTTGTGITAIGDFVFRIALAEEASLPALIDFVAGQTHIESGVLFYETDDAYSRTSADAIRAGMAAIGAELALEVDVSASGALEQALEDPALAGADVFLVPTFTEGAAPVLTALREAGLEQPVIGGEAIASLDLVRLAGDAAEGTYVASTWHPDAGNDLSRDFVSAYTDAYDHPPEHFAAESYTAVYVLHDAIRRAGSVAPEAVRDAIAATEDYETVLGSLSIARSGDAVFEPVFQQFQGGQIVVVD